MILKILAGITQFAAQGESSDFCLRDFLDNFYAHPDALALQSEPPILATKNPRFGQIEDAYLAATAEWLAWKFDLQPSPWIFDESRSLRRPWFASSLAVLRAILLLKSPVVSFAQFAICMSAEML